MTTAAPSIIGNYKAEATPHGLLVRDVELSGETSRDERPDFESDLTVKTFQSFLDNYTARKRAGKVGAFVTLGVGGHGKEPGVGRIENLRVVGKELVGDLLITNPEVQKALERGELTERSIVFSLGKNPMLKGVTLLSGEFGQDSVGWKDLTIDYAKEFRDDNPEHVGVKMTTEATKQDTPPEENEQAGDMEERMKALEQDMNDIKATLAKMADGDEEKKQDDEEEKATLPDPAPAELPSKQLAAMQGQYDALKSELAEIKRKSLIDERVLNAKSELKGRVLGPDIEKNLTLYAGKDEESFDAYVKSVKSLAPKADDFEVDDADKPADPEPVMRYARVSPEHGKAAREAADMYKQLKESRMVKSDMTLERYLTIHVGKLPEEN
jgi:hypothetical protein